MQRNVGSMPRILAEACIERAPEFCVLLVGQAAFRIYSVASESQPRQTETCPTKIDYPNLILCETLKELPLLEFRRAENQAGN